MAKATVPTPKQGNPDTSDLQDELYDAGQRTKLAFWIEAARTTIDELREAVARYPDLHSNAALKAVLRHPIDWDDDMSGAMQTMHLANSGVLRQARQVLQALEG